MVDSGATALFINKKFVKQHNMMLRELRRPIPLYNIDGTINQSGSLTHYVCLQMTLGTHTKILDFLATDIGPKNIILGLPWLKRVNSVIDWDTGEMELPDSPESQALPDTPFEQINANRATCCAWIKAGIIDQTSDEL